MTRTRPWAILLGLAVLLTLPSGQAHAVRLASDPAPGQQVAAAPDHVEITFTEPTDEGGTTLQVVDAAGERVDLQDPTTTGGPTPTWRLSLRPGLPDGPYRLLWQTLSTADGHVERGTVGFAIGDGQAAGSSEGHAGAIEWPAVVARLLAFAGLAVAFGAAVFLAWVPGAAPIPRAPVLQALLAGAALHLAGVLALLAVTHADAGLPLGTFFATAIGQGLAVRVGLGLLSLAFAGIAAAPRMPARAPPYVAVAALAGAALAAARFGHAALAGTAGIAVDAIHLLAAATWAGGLAVFLWMLAGPARATWTTSDLQAAGIRFGTAALACVLALLAAGGAASLAILGPPGALPMGDLVASTWGRALAGKLVLTAAMLGLAVVNRYAVLEPATDAGFAGAVQRLVRRARPDLVGLGTGRAGLRGLVRTEALLGLATLALAAILTSVSPPSTVEAPPAAPLEAFASGLDYHASLLATPAPVVGDRSDLVIHVATHGGTALQDNTCGRPSCLTLVIGHNGTGATYTLERRGGGDWGLDDVLWAEAGTIEAQLTVSSAEAFADPMTFVFNVRPNG